MADRTAEALEVRAWLKSLPAGHPLKTRGYLDVTDIPADSPLARKAARIYNAAFSKDQPPI